MVQSRHAGSRLSFNYLPKSGNGWGVNTLETHFTPEFWVWQEGRERKESDGREDERERRKEEHLHPAGNYPLYPCSVTIWGQEKFIYLFSIWQGKRDKRADM